MAYLEQRLLLQQKLSPQQVLFSTLLQMPVMALEQKIKTELELNPLLEEVTEVEQDQDPEIEQKIEQNSPEESSEEETETKEADDELNTAEEEVSWEELLNDNDEDSYSYSSPTDREYVSLPDPAPVSLNEHLISQLHLQSLTDQETEIGEFIIWNINEDGYLSIAIEEIVTNLDVSQEIVQKILAIIQTFDPVGIGARNLQECLLIQLREKDSPPLLAIDIIENHFDDFKNKRFEKLSKRLEVSLEKIKKAIDIISRLNPKPGEGYFSAAENYIIPDILVERVGNEFVISLNDWNTPQLRISSAYKKLISEKGKVPAATKQYIKQKIESARWLINSIQQRKITILNVMKEIVNRQRDFFEHGKGHIKPMILNDIASAINMDISTISRVTNGKYVQTDHGVFELKYFFSEKMTTFDGEHISTLNIKDKIKDIIENEDSKNPLTDDNIVKVLVGQGIPIARRTVAKYREQLRIPVARLRRQI